LGALLDAYIAHSTSVGLSPATLREYRRIAERTIPEELRKVKLSKLTARQLDSLYASLTAKGNAATTVRRVHALISASLHQAEKWDMVDRNVAKQASPPPIRTEEPSVPTPEEVVHIIKTAETILVDPGNPNDVDVHRASQMFADLFTLAALSGARRGELVGLRWSDWNRDACTLRIERSVYEVAGGGWHVKDVKNHAGRTVALDVSALRALGRRWESAVALANRLGLELPDEGYIFSVSPTGSTPIMPDRATKVFTAAAKAAGVDAHLHSLRHWAATEMIASGVPVPVAAKRLGHRDSSVTLRTYSHALPRQDSEAAAMLGRSLDLPRQLPQGA
jgi:integrase